MLTEVQLCNKRSAKSLHRKRLLMGRQAQIARLSRHNYGIRNIVRLIEEQQGMLATIKKFAANVMLVLKQFAWKRRSK